MTSATDAISSLLDPEKAAKTANEAAQAAERLVALMKDLKGSFAFLKSMPSIALLKINRVLDEVGKTVDAVQNAGGVFLEMVFDINKGSMDPKVLIDLSSTKLQALIELKRGHSSTIRAIRQDYLNGWLNQLAITQVQKNSKDDSLKKLNEIFDGLDDADGYIFKRLATLAEYIQAESQKALVLYLNQRPKEARDVIKEAALRVLELQATLGEVQREMLNIRAEFIEAMKLSEAGQT